MALTDLADFLTKMDEATPLTFIFAANTVASYSLESWFQTGPSSGVTPTTSVALNDTTVGAAMLDGQYELPTLTGTKGIAAIEHIAATSISTSNLMLIDRLVHQGGLNAAIGTVQTTNLPTAALPSRATGGAGVMLGTEVYGAIGTGVPVFSATYTNQAGTGSRVTRAQQLGPASAPVGTFRIHPLASGDTGVQSVQSVQMLSASASAGNFGVVLFKPICGFYVGGATFRANNNLELNMLFNGLGVIPQIPDNACLQLIGLNQNTSTGVLICTIKRILI